MRLGGNRVSLAKEYKQYEADEIFSKCPDLMHRARAKERFGEAFFSKANHFGTPIFNMNVDRTLDQPTFWEFVQYVKENPEGNEHWAPAHSYCDPCAFKYETIAYFENLGGEGNEGHLLSMTIAPKNHTLKSQARRNAHKGIHS